MKILYQIIMIVFVNIIYCRKHNTNIYKYNLFRLKTNLTPIRKILNYK